MRALGCLVATTVLLFAAPGRGAPRESTPVHIHYRAPADCPPAEEFLDAVHRAAPHMRGAKDDEPAPAFDITIDTLGDDDRRRGKLVFETNGRTGIRAVDAASCVEASSLLAFATALAIGDEEVAEPRPSEPVRDLPKAIPARERRENVRQDISMSVAGRFQNDDHGDNPSLGASLLFRRGLLVVGGVGDLAPFPTRWDVGPALGIAVQPLAWFRVDLLGVAGIDAYSEVRHANLSATQAFSALLPFVGGRVRATVEVANVALGVEGLVETDIGSAKRSYSVDELRGDVPTTRQDTFTIGTHRVAAGLVLGTTFGL